MATFGTLLYTAFYGRKVGKDIFGNAYYEDKSHTSFIGRKKRWVVYKGIPEASKVPAEWHSWLHYTTDVIPSEKPRLKYAWLKGHLPNLTGTRLAYRQPGHIDAAGQHAPTIADYQAWKP